MIHNSPNLYVRTVSGTQCPSVPYGGTDGHTDGPRLRDGIEPPTALPELLVRRLAETTGQGIKGRVQREAVTARHRCGGLVVVGLDDEAMAWPAYVDPIPLTQVGEALALLAGRNTYRLRGAYVFTVTRRGPWDIERGWHDHPIVLASHECATPIPAEWRM